MSQTIQTEHALPSLPRSLRTFLSEEEYQKQKQAHTRKELKTAGLYYQHTFHFVVLSLKEKLAGAMTKKILIAVGIAFVALLLACLLTPGQQHASEGGSLVPMTFTQRVKNVPYEFIEKLKMLMGQSRKGLLLPEEVFKRFSSNQDSNETRSVPLESTKRSEEAPKKTVPIPSPVAESDTEAPLVTPSPSFSTFVSSHTYSGMNIFAFAFCVARDFASSLFGSAFGWSNATAP